MGLPYSDDELKEMIDDEDKKLREGGWCDLTEEITAHQIWWRGAKYVVTGANFIRSIEPFNQELCDALFASCEKAFRSVACPLYWAIQLTEGVSMLPNWLAREIDNDPTFYERFENGKLTSAERKRIEEAQDKEREEE
jgi:predicted membrane-bound mannosyltransferase